MADKVIPLHMIPDVQSEVIERDGKRYLQSNESMFTFYKRSKGEFSKYFLGLKEEKKIYGAKCPKCGLVRVPPFMLFCPDCDFAELEVIEVAQEGVMNSTPPITYFGHSLMQHQVPFGRGRVMLDGADTALPIHVYTTKGVLTPRVFKRGTRVKVVFRNDRIGNPRDVFAVPIDEVPENKRRVKGLQENDLDWLSPAEPRIPAATPEAQKTHESVVQQLIAMASQAAGSDRAKKDLAGWKRTIQVKTAGGAFGLKIDDGKLAVEPKGFDRPDLVMIAADPRLFSDWMNSKESLTNAIIAEKLWISHNKEFTTVFKLDRVPRSLRRTQK
jgi:uncharacterized OB-fold protein